ncbi:VlmK-like protein [Streptomyces sp. WAC07149]|uniref:MmgE/PrpD family protein n=1 Tax=Streptomyces sp. WAC07149 TaxID=2487425 RepID=UPI000F7970DA|nr:MmgE/PrpD family protein [Streptomyces sp. WAC07149]RST06962.1 VlmK-like protein [Streptomyces sp. WAC07149]
MTAVGHAGRAAELAGWAAALRPGDLPDRVVALARSQVLSQLAAIRTGLTHPLGRRLVSAFGEPLQGDPARSAAVLAGLGSWLNLDDTAYAGHLSNSTVATPLAYARARGLDGAAFLTAVVAANECAARVTAAATLGPFRGQTAAHTSLVGGVAGRLHCAGAPAATWTHALGLALTMPPWTLTHGFLSGDARVLSALTPVRAAMDACDAAEAGLTAAADVLEHPEGFLARFAVVPLPEAVAAGLGRRWHTDTLSFKVRPGGPGVDTAVDCALRLRRELPDADFGEGVEEVLVETSRYTTYVGRLADQHGHGPDTPASVLPLSVPYAVATALLTGDLSVADFTEPAVRDPRRWALAARVRLVEDPGMTDDLLASAAPFGAAVRQAGGRAVGWLASFAGRDAARRTAAAPPEETFEAATKHTGSRVTVRWGQGRTATARRDVPIGAAGEETRARHGELVREKFRKAGGPDEAAALCARLEELSAGELAALAEGALGGV